MSVTGEGGDMWARIDGALVVGKTNNTEWLLDNSHPWGVVCPRTENFNVWNVKFYNFNEFSDKQGAIGTCSHCWHDQATDSGGRTITFKNVFFDPETVPRRIKYTTPFRTIFHDLDGTLTDKGPNSWATYYYQHLETPECEHNHEVFHGVVCDNRVQIRRVAFGNAQPTARILGMPMMVLRIDDDMVGPTEESKIAYYENKTNYGVYPFKEKQDPGNGWAGTFVTGHKYKVHWGMGGLDLDQMGMYISERWESTDLPIHLTHNFTDVREAIEFRLDGELIENNTIASNQNDW